MLPIASVESMSAMIAGDAVAFTMATGASVEEPLIAPPLMDDTLPSVKQALEADPEVAPWWARWIIDWDGLRLVGSIGAAGRPLFDGVVTVGYLVYPAEQRRGYASEAARGLVAWLLALEDVKAVQATIPAGHTASERVAKAAGMHFTGQIETTEDGAVGVWERRWR